MVDGACQPARPNFISAQELRTCGAVDPIMKLAHPRTSAMALNLGVIYLYVPKAASSSNRMYVERVLNGSASVPWPEAVATVRQSRPADSAAVTLTFTRDPAARFVSAVGTILHRYNFSELKLDPNSKLLTPAKKRESQLEACFRPEWALPAPDDPRTVSPAWVTLRAQNILCALSHAESHGLAWDEHVSPQVSYYGIPSNKGGPVAFPSSVLAAPLGTSDADYAAAIDRGWALAVRKASPGRVSVDLPSFASVGHGLTNAHEGSSTKVKKVSAEEEAAHEAAREAAVWQALERSHFGRRISALYKIDYTCLGLCPRAAATPPRRLSLWD